jgi:hypothetical protein
MEVGGSVAEQFAGIPTLMAGLIDQKQILSLDEATVREAIAELDHDLPPAGARVLQSPSFTSSSPGLWEYG